MSREVYREPLVSRYTSKPMQRVWSEDFKFGTWRKCWNALAEAQNELGLERVTDEMVAELKRAAQEPIDYEVADAEERARRHDVMAHVHEYGTHAPKARGVIHLGATSQYPCCNTELIQLGRATDLLHRGTVNVLHNFRGVAREHKGLVTLGYTHGQPAQPTTIGKRVTLYMQDLVSDLYAIEGLQILARGAKGTVGTQASYLELFKGDYSLVKELDARIAEKLGFAGTFPVTGQTYPRKFDTKVAEAVAGLGVTLGKFALDLRLMSRDRIVDEPFQAEQTGSSAMPYKRNPMRSERLTALTRKLVGLPSNFYDTARNQWFERTLDDSSIRRMDLPQLYLLADAALVLANNITDQEVDPEKMRPLTFYPKRIAKLMNEELPFMASEAILMDLVQQGHDRQEMHEALREHSVAAGLAIKEEGADNTLFSRLGADEQFPMTEQELNAYLEKPERFAGAAQQQTEEYLETIIDPILEERKALIGTAEGEVNV